MTLFELGADQELGSDGEPLVERESELPEGGSIQVSQVRVTAEYKFPEKEEPATMILISQGSFSSNPRLFKSCFNGFDPDLSFENPIEFVVPLSTDLEGEVKYALFSVDYGRNVENWIQFSIPVLNDSEDFDIPFPSNEEPETFLDVFGFELDRFVVFTKRNKTQVEASSGDEEQDLTKPQVYFLNYENTDIGVRYELRVIWTPPEQPESGDQVIPPAP